jgi:hypothetical protein
MFKDLYSLLPPYGQILLTIGIVFVGVVAAWRGFLDIKKTPAPPSYHPDMPIWLMMGPMHDAFQSVHEIAEQSRVQVAILRDIDKTLVEIDRGTQYTHYVLEAILRNQELGGDPQLPPKGYRRS